MSDINRTMTLTPEEAKVLDVFRQAKKERHSIIEIAIKDAIVVQVKWEHKVDLLGMQADMRRLRENANS